jgi:hypothetical protein
MTSFAPPESRRTIKRSPVVAIGVVRGGIGRDDGACRLYLPFSKTFILRSSHPALVGGIMLLVERVVVR